MKLIVKFVSIYNVNEWPYIIATDAMQLFKLHIETLISLSKMVIYF